MIAPARAEEAHRRQRHARCTGVGDKSVGRIHQPTAWTANLQVRQSCIDSTKAGIEVHARAAARRQRPQRHAARAEEADAAEHRAACVIGGTDATIRIRHHAGVATVGCRRIHGAESDAKARCCQRSAHAHNGHARAHTREGPACNHHVGPVPRNRSGVRSNVMRGPHRGCRREVHRRGVAELQLSTGGCGDARNS